MRRDRLELDAAPDAVPRARRFVTRLLDAWDLPQLGPDAELAVTELVTNALLHAGPPIAVVVAANGALRIAVHDPSAVPPMRARAGPEAMTGRGLALIEALADRWGVERTEGGKAVWCELDVRGHAVAGHAPGRAAAPEDVDAILAAWDDLVPSRRARAEPTFEVALGDVPTDLLLAAKAHVDNVVRELTLVRAGANAGETAAVPAHLARMVENVVVGFSEARNAIKRQALDAAARGDERVRLTLTLPLSAADAGERYLAALDDADAYARAARLLTLEAPPQHRVFRHWYVESLVTQLRSIAAGKPAEPPPTFEQYLLGTVDAIAAAWRSADRATRLQHVAGALAASATPPAVAEIVVTSAVRALGARAGMLLVTEKNQVARLAGQIGYPDEVVARIVESTLAGSSPAALAATTGQPVWIESREERDTRFPALASLEPSTVSLCVVPLQVAGQVRGVLRFSFDQLRLFDAGERQFVLALAAQAAQALERAQLYESQRRLADRLTRLQRVTAALAATRTVADVTRVVIDHATGVLGAEVSAMCLLSEDGKELELTEARAEDMSRMAAFRRFPVDAELPAAEAVRTGKPVVLASVADRDARYPSLATLAPRHEHTVICLPLVVNDRTLGAFNLTLPGANAVDEDGLEFLTALADACAQALDRTRALERARALATENARLRERAAAKPEPDEMRSGQQGDAPPAG